MNKKFKFYVLFDEEYPDIPRYVGVTGRLISERFSQHKYCANHEDKRALPVHKWMHSVYKKGGKIGFRQIHECAENLWESEELRLISEYSANFPLLNLDKGGRGVVTSEQREKSGIKRSIEAHKKAVVQLDKEGRILQEFNSIKEACDSLNISKTSMGNCLNGRSKTAGGYVWKYKDTFDRSKVETICSSRGRNIKVFKYTFNMQYVEEFNSLTKAGKSVNRDPRTIQRYLDSNKPLENFYWFSSKQTVILSDQLGNLLE